MEVQSFSLPLGGDDARLIAHVRLTGDGDRYKIEAPFLAVAVIFDLKPDVLVPLLNRADGTERGWRWLRSGELGFFYVELPDAGKIGFRLCPGCGAESNGQECRLKGLAHWFAFREQLGL